MFDKLIDVVLEFIYDIIPCSIVHYYEGGVREWCGKTKKYVGPGIWFKFPFLHTIHKHMIKTTTMELKEQSITTKDDISVIVNGVIKYDVHDPVTLLMEVGGAVEALADTTQGIIRDVLSQLNWDECNTPEIGKKITKLAKKEALYWGINVQKVTLPSLVKAPSFKLFNSQSESSS